MGNTLTWYEHSHAGYAQFNTTAAPTSPLDAAFFTCFALAENLEREKSPKSSESSAESLSLNTGCFLLTAVALAIGLAVADFLGATFRCWPPFCAFDDFLLFFGSESSEAAEEALAPRRADTFLTLLAAEALPRLPRRAPREELAEEAEEARRERPEERPLRRERREA